MNDTIMAAIILGIFIIIAALSMTTTDTGIYYGEMWNKLDSGFVTVDLTDPNVYLQVTNLTAGLMDGISFSGSNLTVEKTGIYKIIGSVSMEAGGNGEFGITIFQNDLQQEKCYTHSHHTSLTAQSMNLNCLLRLNAGDKIGLYVDDHATPVNDPIFLSVNVNMLKIDN